MNLESDSNSSRVHDSLPGLEFFGAPVRSFNMEITNRCTLSCSECARTDNPWVLNNLTQLPVELLRHVIGERWSAVFQLALFAHKEIVNSATSASSFLAGTSTKSPEPSK